MARVLRWTVTAWRDLEEIADYIARDSPYYAASFVRKVRDEARSLCDLAERGRVVPELDDPTIREVFIHRYRIIYRVTDDAVHLLGVIHGVRDFHAAWDQENRE